MKIDKVFIINLKQRTDRKQFMIDQMNSQNENIVKQINDIIKERIGFLSDIKLLDNLKEILSSLDTIDYIETIDPCIYIPTENIFNKLHKEKFDFFNKIATQNIKPLLPASLVSIVKFAETSKLLDDSLINYKVFEEIAIDLNTSIFGNDDEIEDSEPETITSPVIDKLEQSNTETSASEASDLVKNTMQQSDDDFAFDDFDDSDFNLKDEEAEDSDDNLNAETHAASNINQISNIKDSETETKDSHVSLNNEILAPTDINNITTTKDTEEEVKLSAPTASETVIENAPSQEFNIDLPEDIAEEAPSAQAPNQPKIQAFKPEISVDNVDSDSMSIQENQFIPNDQSQAVIDNNTDKLDLGSFLNDTSNKNQDEDDSSEDDGILDDKKDDYKTNKEFDIDNFLNS